jgi:N-acetyl sugar amidotransferase
MPNTRPDTEFVNGECTACYNKHSYPVPSVQDRSHMLIEVCERAKRNAKHADYDVIVPSSGGKDSTYQALTMKNLGLRVLAVTATTCALTNVGRMNLDNLSRHVDTLEVSPNKSVRRRLNKLGLTMVGDISWPEHVAIFTTPFRVAAQMGIPLIMYGENPQREYGCPVGAEQAMTMTRRWVTEFGGQLGMRPTDLIGRLGITAANMAPYMWLTDTLPDYIEAHFLGQYIPWDSRHNTSLATAHGMITDVLPSSRNWWRGENLDNYQTGIHDYFGYLKYGFGRASVQLSVDIRNDFTRRDVAMLKAAERDSLWPETYMGMALADILYEIDVSQEQFIETCNTFYNRQLFANDRVEWGSRLLLRDHDDIERVQARAG